MKFSGLCAIVLAAAMTASCGQVQPAPEAVVEAPPRPPMPALAEWIAPLSGKTLGEVAPSASTDCVGFVDGLNIAYADGARLIGWAWNTRANAAYNDFLAVDSAGVVRGGGAGGLERPDVTAALPDQVTGVASGFVVDTSVASGSITVYAYDAAAGSACKVGEKTY